MAGVRLPKAARSYAFSLARPFTGVSPRLRARLTVIGVTAAALLFPLVNQNDADIDFGGECVGLRRLGARPQHRRRLRRIARSRLCRIFAIGAYAYGVASSWQLQPAWSGFWEPFEWLDLVTRFHAAGGDVVHFQVSFWLMLPIAAAIAALFGVLFGAPTLRLKGDYLAIVTLGFGEIVPIVARNIPSVTNGAMGLNGVAAPRFFGLDFGIDATPYYYVGVGLVALLIVTSQRLKDSQIGRAWMAIREDEVAAMAMGVDRVRYKLLAFAIGAAFAGATGTFYVAKLQTATPEMFMFPVSVMILVMVVFGGIGSVWGVVVGALLLQILQSWFLEDLSGWLHALGRLVGVEWLQRVELASSIELIFGLILVLMMLFRRQGLIPPTRRTPVLSLDEQTIQPERSSFTTPTSIDHSSRSPLLEIADLTVRFGGLVALQSVELNVPAHSVLAVIGPNGSGKSTLFNAITGLVPTDHGTILFAGEEIDRLPPHHVLERGIARTFQNIRLFPNLSVHRERDDRYACAARYGSARRRAAAAGDPQRGSSGARARPPDPVAVRQPATAARRPFVASLSYANRRRVEIARALASQPEAAAARRTDRRDEPGRDPGARRPDQEPQPPGPDDRPDRAQARRRRRSRRQGRRARPRREDRRGHARRGAPRRGGDPRLSRAKCRFA